MKIALIQKNEQITGRFDLTGKFTIVLIGGQQVTGEFTKSELEQIGYRIEQTTKGLLAFDQPPSDVIGLHAEDMATLERQSLVINELRAENGDLMQRLEQADETVQGFSQDLIVCRNELRDVRIELSQANEKLAKASSGVTMTPLELSLGEIVTATFPPEARTAENPHIGSALDSELMAETGEVQTKLPPDKFEADFEESAPLL